MLAASAWVAWRSPGGLGLGAWRKAVAVALAFARGLSLLPSLRRNLADPAFGLGTGAPAEDQPSSMTRREGGRMANSESRSP
jgi:hypothetical protein